MQRTLTTASITASLRNGAGHPVPLFPLTLPGPPTLSKPGSRFANPRVHSRAGGSWGSEERDTDHVRSGRDCPDRAGGGRIGALRARRGSQRSERLRGRGGPLLHLPAGDHGGVRHFPGGRLRAAPVRCARRSDRGARPVLPRPTRSTDQRPHPAHARPRDLRRTNGPGAPWGTTSSAAGAGPAIPTSRCRPTASPRRPTISPTRSCTGTARPRAVSSRPGPPG